MACEEVEAECDVKEQGGERVFVAVYEEMDKRFDVQDVCECAGTFVYEDI